MSDGHASRPAGLADIVDLAARMELDGGLPLEELRERDRQIGRGLESLKAKPSDQLLSWLDQMREGRRDLPGAALDRALRFGNVLLFLAGLLLGWLAAAAVYYYDGSHPVNVVNILAVFVGAQLLLTILLILTLAPKGLRRLLPGSRAVFDTLDLLKPGRLAGMALRRLPQGHRDRALSLFGGGRSHGRVYGNSEKWAVTFSSQVFALAFNIGAVLGALHLVFFSDLAFAWSTTLKITAEDIHGLTELLSLPWSSWLPSASPSLSLVESSRYFRLHEGLLPPDSANIPGGPEVLGEWWPFLIMAMLVYGLLPRVGLLILASLRLRAATVEAFIGFPGARGVLARMNGPLVDTRSRETESVGIPPKPSEFQVPGMAAASEGPQACINWGEAPFGEEALLRALGGSRVCSATGLLAAGGGSTVTEDREVIRRAAGEGAAGIALFVRSWEPPMEDLIDFLGELREAVGRTVSVTVVLVGPPDGHRMGAVDKTQARVWSTRLGSLGDPWLSVVLPGGATP